MNKSESIGNLAKALAAVQAKIQPAVKDSKNPYFKSNYADLNAVWNSCRALLAANGLSVAQVNSVGAENTVVVETVLMHESGEWISGELCLPLVKTDPQGVGSAVTYGRRYGLAAIVGIIADEDDDANHASGKTTAAAKPKRGLTEVVAEIRQIAGVKKVALTDVAYGTTKRTNNVEELTLDEAEKALEFLKRK